MPEPLPEVINVLLIAEPDPRRLARVEQIAPGRLHVSAIPARELALDVGELWPPDGREAREAETSLAERDAALAGAHVILLGLPYPTICHARTRDLRWVHHPNAGASNLRQSDFWGAPVVVTTSRGANAALPIAESAVAGILMFARGLDFAARGSMDRRDYRANVTLAGKTVGIVGLGGIGAHVARLAHGLGMTVIGTRRSATTRQPGTDSVAEVYPPGDLHEVLARSDFVVVAAMLTDETEGLLDRDAFAAMKDGAVLVNVARGEIVDEDALVGALASGRLRGAYLDVYSGELGGQPPRRELRDDPRVVFTPHISGMADQPGKVGFDLFLENLARFVRQEPLENVVDWSRGY